MLLGRYFDRLFQNEKLQATQLRIYPMDKNFIETAEVQKLIKIKDSSLKNIDVIQMEQNLEKNDYISNAEVYKDLNGRMIAEIEQYHPIARVLGNSSYYIDVNGDKKPLSHHYTEHVVLIFGDLNKENRKEIIDLIKRIDEDEILKNLVSEIHTGKSVTSLKTVNLSADIRIDIHQNLDRQLFKLKVINSYLTGKKLEKQYKNIDLRYEKQAVCK